MINRFLTTLAAGLITFGSAGMASAQIDPPPVQILATPDSVEFVDWGDTYEFYIDKSALVDPREFENDSGYLFISETNGDFNNPPNEVIVVHIDGVYFGSHAFFDEDEWNAPTGTTKMLAIPLDYTDLFYIKNNANDPVVISITPVTTWGDNVVSGTETATFHSVWIGYNKEYTIDDLIDFIVAEGIQLDIEGNPGNGQLKKFQNILKDAKEAYDSGDLYTACDLLQDAADRSDGDYVDGSPEDLIVDSSDENDVQKVFNILSIAIAHMQRDQQYCGF